MLTLFTPLLHSSQPFTAMALIEACGTVRCDRKGLKVLGIFLEGFYVRVTV